MDQAKQLADSVMLHIGSYTINIYGLIIAAIFLFFVVAIWRAHRKNDLNWIDMITSIDPGSGQEKVSATKVLQLLGGITGTFIVVKLTLQEKITWDIFATYLAYVASIDGFSKFILAKYGVTQPNKDN